MKAVQAVALIMALGLSLALSSTNAAPQPSALPEYEGLIRVQNGRFVDDNCQEFSVMGMNTWMLMETAAGLAYQPYEPSGMDAVQFTFSTAAANSLTVVRAFAHGVNDTLPLQTSPGVYNETAFKALDYILDTAAYNSVKVIFTMGDNWQYADSKRNYNMWAGLDENSDEFWTSNVTRQMYKDHMRVMVNRVNTLNGLRYGDDPAIFAWNLINEPRCNCFPVALPYPAIFSQLPPGCAPSCANTITDWVGEMSAYLKKLDSNHLVTVGEEGFWGYYDATMQSNPENSVSPWAALTGDNFTAQHNFRDIDFATVHYWPDQWTPTIASDWSFFVPWMQQHMNLSMAMGKPLVLEELGKGVVVNETVGVLDASIASRRLPFMQMVYGQFNQSLQAGGNWRGTLFWKWGYSPSNTADDVLQVASQDPDFTSVIAPTALSALLQAASESPLPGCLKVEMANLTALTSPTTSPGILTAALTAAPTQAELPTLPATTVTAAPGSVVNPDQASIAALQTAG